MQHDEHEKDLPLASVSEKEIKKHGKKAVAYLRRTGNIDLLDMIGLGGFGDDIPAGTEDLRVQEVQGPGRQRARPTTRYW